MEPTQINQWNQELAGATPEQIIAKALGVAQAPLVTTNFRPYEVAILHAVNRMDPSIKVIWCDTGYNTPQTYKHAQYLIEQLRLQVHTYVPQQTVAYRNVVLGIPEIDSPAHVLFTDQVKLEPFRRAMAEHTPDVWFTNLRKGQTALRDSLDIFSLGKDGVLKVSPFYHWSDTDLDLYLEQHQLPNEHKYYDPTKALANRECGLHT
ncbi:phosphoadenosine phosphosulfate reductase domain-containing protein [Sediminicola luteus]|uniref:Phosphoadenylylsulfate reductase n=1 Tax=Sediminicola luteus TaxID=319238 RepID=A0A2A4G2X9_9FLAO|nr:phosphoadenosine phosphosulfate reductase family protein [Sediminicola luteus]PCE63329.1 phosphoadenylylsulfate reductase [Sediminicola luteus]